MAAPGSTCPTRLTSSISTTATRPPPPRPAASASRHHAGQQKRHHDPGQHDVADGITDQRLTPQDQEVSGQGAGDRREDADQDRCERELTKSLPMRSALHGTGRTDAPVELADLVGIVKTSSIGVRPLYRPVSPAS
jgi:hypothetical protein